jgi:hypothetical protein
MSRTGATRTTPKWPPVFTDGDSRNCAAFFLSNKSESVRLFAAPDLDDGEQEDTNHDHRTGGV